MTDEWVETLLGSSTDITKGRKPELVNDLGIGETYLLAEYLRTGQATKWVAEDTSVISANQDDTLILWDGAGAGDVFPGANGVVASTMARIRSVDERIDARFLQLQIASKVSEIKASNRGTTVPHVSPEALRAIPILIPPLSAQRRIVDLLAHLDNHLANLQTEREAAEIARLASLESRLRLVEGETKCLGDVLNIARGGSPRPIDDYFTDSPDGLNWIKIGDVPAEGRYITGTAQKIRPEGLSKTRQVKSGDFLLSNSMSFGRPYILRIDGCIHDGWLVLAGVDGAFEPEYLYFLLRSNGVQDQFRSLAAGSGVKNLNIKVVNSVEVVVPSKEVQASLAAEASAWMELVEGLDAEIASLRQFRHFLLSALLSRGLALPPAYDSFLAEAA